MAIPENIRINAQVPFPSLVSGIAPVYVQKVSGIWGIGLNVGALGTIQPPITKYTTDFLLVWDSVLQTYSKVSLDALAIGLACPEVVIDGGGSPIAPGIKIDLTMPAACTLTGWRLLADQPGSIVLDLWKDTYGNYPPTVADTITGGNKPTLSAANKNEDTTLTGWTTTFAKGDTLRINVDSAATIQRVTFAPTLLKS